MVRERRRAPRVPAPEGAGGVIRSTIQVHVEDVSRTGVRFQLSGAVRPGATYSFHAGLDGFDLFVPIRITRCKAAAAPSGVGRAPGLVYQAGAEFLWEKAEDQERFAAWLNRPGPSSGQFSANLKA